MHLIEKFTYLPEENCYVCPEGKLLNLYHSTAKRCRDCAQKTQCTRGKYRVMSVHVCEAAQQMGL